MAPEIDHLKMGAIPVTGIVGIANLIISSRADAICYLNWHRGDLYGNMHNTSQRR